jgi:hypothetical protein
MTRGAIMNAFQSVSKDDPRINPIDAKREEVEGKLMMCEDYTFTKEGKQREAKQLDYMGMAIEDDASTQIEIIERKMRFKENIRNEVLQRQEIERLERLERTRLAEERRRLVLDKIRQRREEEERQEMERKRQVAMIEEEEERRKQQLYEMREEDRRLMAMEGA